MGQLTCGAQNNPQPLPLKRILPIIYFLSKKVWRFFFTNYVITCVFLVFGPKLHIKVKSQNITKLNNIYGLAVHKVFVERNHVIGSMMF